MTCAKIWLTCLALAQGGAVAATPDDRSDPSGAGLRINGYGTLGLAWTDASGPLDLTRDLAEPPQSDALKTLLDSRLAVQTNWRASPELELVAQGVLRRLAPDASLWQRVSWAFASWQPAAEWKLRLGRTSPDMFLLADYRNVGFAYPWVRPNHEYYGFATIQSIDGADVGRSWSQGDARWQARISLGQNSSYQAALRTAGAPTAASPHVDVRDTAVATLSHDEDGLLLKASYVNTRTHVDLRHELDPVQAGLQQIVALGVPGVSAQAADLSHAIDLSALRSQYFALGAQYDRGSWLWTAEISRTQGGHGSDGTRGYVSAGYRVGPWTAFVMLGRSRPAGDAKAPPTGWAAALTPVIGAQAAAGAVQLGTAAAQANNRGRFDERSASIGTRWDLSAQTALKLQYDDLHVGAGGDAGWPGGNGFDPVRAKIVTLTFEFLF